MVTSRTIHAPAAAQDGQGARDNPQSRARSDVTWKMRMGENPPRGDTANRQNRNRKHRLALCH